MEKALNSRRRRGFTPVSPKHEVTIGVEALALAGVRVGDSLRVEVRPNGEIVLTRAQDALQQYAGSLTGLYAPDELARLRAEWELTVEPRRTGTP